MSDLIAAIEKYEKAEKALKDQTRLANSALGALQHERKAIEKLLETIPVVTDLYVIDLIRDAVGPKLKSFAEELNQHQHLMFDTIMEAFIKLIHIMIEGKHPGRGDSVIADCERALREKTDMIKAQLKDLN